MTRRSVNARPSSPRWLTGGHRASAFTLIELLVVLAIASLLLTLVPPLFSTGLAGIQGQGSGRDLLMTLGVARSQAISHKRVTDVALETHGYRIIGTDRGNAMPKRWTIRVFDAITDEQREHTWIIRFYPDGTSSGGRIQLTDGARRYQFEVEWLTGRVKKMPEQRK